MDILVTSLAAALASTLTLFSGFGLGTLLMPVMALFVPVEIAVASTAVVHLANNLFKVVLVGRSAVGTVLWRFGVPAVLMALLGALVLGSMSARPRTVAWSLFGQVLQVPLIDLVLGVLILLFVLLEFLPFTARIQLGPRYLPMGGALSGFFGGLSGHQGMFRSMFLLKAGLDQRQFVATGVVLAAFVDVARLAVYGWQANLHQQAVDWPLVGCASLAAFAGAWLGARFLHKVTLGFVRWTVFVLLVVVGVGMVTGQV